MAVYDDYMDHAFAGMKGDSGNDRVESFACAAAVPFGVVATGADTVSAGGSDEVRGITLATATTEDAGTYAKNDCASVLSRGLAWAKVTASQTVTEDGKVYFAADGSVSDLNTNTALTNATFRSAKVTVADGDIALVELAHPFA